MTENEIARTIVDAAFKIHNALGPGLLESAYGKVLKYELERRGLKVEKQVTVPIMYEGLTIDEGFVADLIVEEKVIIELKSVEAVAPVHKKQLLTYLKLTGKKLGLLINFNVALIKDGITRIVNRLE
jgi:GxxExxY protein